MTSSQMPDVHALALIKGSVEGDSYKHFGSLLGVREHGAPLVRAGLLVDDGFAYEPTEQAREFYTRHSLDELPAGRANNWSPSDPVVGPLLTAASGELDSLRP